MMRTTWPLAWRHARWFSGGWLRAAGCAALLIGAYALALIGGEGTPLHRRVIEIVMPFLFGLQAALVFAPDDEPALEVMLACPRPAAYIVVERLLFLAALQGGIALAATVFATRLPQAEMFLPALIRWLVPALFISSATIYLSMVARRAAFGLLLSVVVCFVALVGGDYIVQLYPWMRYFHLYLEPGHATPADFTLNRVILCALAVLIFARTLWLSRDAERLLDLK